MSNFFVSPSGRDENSGTSRDQAWKTLRAAGDRASGHTVIVERGTYRESIPRKSGIHWKSREPLQAILDGSEAAGSGWQRDAQGTWSKPWTRQPFGAWQGNFERDGKYASFFWRVYNQHGSNPMLDINPADPATQVHWKGGRLYLRTIGGVDPQAGGVVIAVHNIGVDLGDGSSGASNVTLEGFKVRYFGSAVGTGPGANIHLIGCDFGYTGKVGVWLTKLTGSSMRECRVQGSGCWAGHYEDCVWIEGGQGLVVDGLDASYGGHSGIIILGTDGVKIHRLHAHAMGGSLLTVKQEADGLLVTDSWLTEAPTTAQVDAHKVPHAAVQLSGKGHTFRNTVLRDSGKGVLASSDGNAGSNPFCADILYDRCTFEGFEAGAVEGQEYAPAGRLERNTWQACIIKGDVALFYAGAGDRNSNKIIGSQVVGSTRGVILTDSGPNPRPNTGSTLTAPPQIGGPTPPDPPNGGNNPPPSSQKPLLEALMPSSGQSGTVVRATGKNLAGAAMVVSVTRKPETPDGKRRVSAISTATSVQWTMPADVVTGPVFARTDAGASNELPFAVGTPPPDPPPLTVSVAVSADGGFAGRVQPPPLAAGSTVTATVRTPDGRTATAQATVAGSGTPPPTTERAFALRVIELSNAERAKEGLQPLMERASLAEVLPTEPVVAEDGTMILAAALVEQNELRACAEGYAQTLLDSGTFSHIGPDGSTPAQRIQRSGYSPLTLAGENLGSGHRTPEEIVTAWMNSPGHRANLMHPGARHTGVGRRSAITVAVYAAGEPG